ncbi:MAG: hypothetical protein PHH20_02475 [Candidatus Omnitrophica bacterium]|nr:hypothetical protein [Candidatus Omnitrophota bacterium]
MDNKKENKILLNIVGWLLIIPIVYMNLKDFLIKTDRPIETNILTNLLAFSVGILLNPISIIGICLLVIANRKK